MDDIKTIIQDRIIYIDKRHLEAKSEKEEEYCIGYRDALGELLECLEDNK